MKTLAALLCGTLTLLVADAAVRANAAVPPPPAPTTAPVVVVIDDGAREPRLEIPRRVLASLRASAGDDDGTRRAGAAPTWHTIVAGLALASALAVGGLWVVRSRSRPGTRNALVLVLSVGLLAVGTGVLWADLPPFGAGRPRPPAPPVEKAPPGITLSEKVPIQVVEDGQAIRLIVSRGHLARLQPNPPAEAERPPAPATPAPKKEPPQDP